MSETTLHRGDHAPPQELATAHGEKPHPSAGTYIRVAVVLFILTALEVAALYLPPIKPILLPVLFVLAGAKFAFVVMFYMHLRFDHKLFTWLFFAGMGVAVTIILAVYSLFRYVHG